MTPVKAPSVGVEDLKNIRFFASAKKSNYAIIRKNAPSMLTRPIRLTKINSFV